MTPEDLAHRLRDDRSRRVVVLSHCLLNENTRYLGGARRAGCIREVTDACVAQGLGIVQLPCPEQQFWGGVLKRRMLRLYGLQRRSRILARVLLAMLPAIQAWSRLAFRRLARAEAHRIEDYLRSGFDVVAVVGVDGSPTLNASEGLEVLFE